MGYTAAADFAAHSDDLFQTVGWHLTANHYPAVPRSMVTPCVVAIGLADAGDWDELIPLPEGILYRGHNEAPVWAIVEQHHLEAFLGSEWE